MSVLSRNKKNEFILAELLDIFESRTVDEHRLRLGFKLGLEGSSWVFAFY